MESEDIVLDQMVESCVELTDAEGNAFNQLNNNSSWGNGSTLNVHFLNGNERQRSFIKKYARHWERDMNLALNFNCTVEESLIRILITPRGGISSSQIGSDASKVMPPKATMHLDLLKEFMTPEDQNTVLHEFGHALGLSHEHQNPNRPFLFVKSEVKKRWPRNDADLELNIISIREGGLYCSAYDPDSVMAYRIPARIIRQLCDSTKPCRLRNHNVTALELSEGDKAKIAYLYPKPTGGYVSLALDGSRQQHSVSFSRPQYSVPRILLGISSLEWDPWASCNATLELTRTHIEGDGFFFGASRGRDNFWGGLTGSWLSVDPLMRDVCLLPRDIRVSADDSEADMNTLLDRLLIARSQIQDDTIDFLFWIKGLTIRHDRNRKSGAVVLADEMYDKRSPQKGFVFMGAVAEVVVNCFALFKKALNADWGIVMIRPQIRESLILVDKTKFRARPELISGISSLAFEYSHDAHPLWFRIVIEDCCEMDSPPHYAFNCRVECCHTQCIPMLTITWVAVAKTEAMEFQPHIKTETMDSNILDIPHADEADLQLRSESFDEHTLSSDEMETDDLDDEQNIGQQTQTTKHRPQMVDCSTQTTTQQTQPSDQQILNGPQPVTKSKQKKRKASDLKDMDNHSGKGQKRQKTFKPEDENATSGKRQDYDEPLDKEEEKEKHCYDWVCNAVERCFGWFRIGG